LASIGIGDKQEEDTGKMKKVNKYIKSFLVCQNNYGGHDHGRKVKHVRSITYYTDTQCRIIMMF